MKHKIIGMVFAVIMLFIFCANAVFALGSIDEGELTDEQRKSISMLNYLTVLSQEINDSKNSRLYLENVYSRLLENTHPNAVDYRTQEHLSDLMSTLKRYRMIATRRDRLEYLFEQNQAKAIKAAVPDPHGLLSATKSTDKNKLVISLVYMAVDSATSYYSAQEENKEQYIQSDWELDDAELEVLDATREHAFEYMLEIVRENDLPGDYALSENAVKDYVYWKNHENTTQKIQFFESHKSTYQEYGDYWLTLASAYFNNKDYEKCVDSIKTYEEKNTRIFRKDHDYAKVLPLAIMSIQESQGENESVSEVEYWLSQILTNTDEEDWDLRYYSAQTFLDLYSLTNDVELLKQAYDIVLNNVNVLVDKQREKNSEYLSQLHEEEIPAGTDKKKKKEIEAYNKSLRKNRGKELPPIYEPLLLNCELLFDLIQMEDLEVADKDKEKINRILHQNDEPIFLVDILDSSYWVQVGDKDLGLSLRHQSFEADFDGRELSIPVYLVTDNAKITAETTDGTVLDDWVIDKVDRINENDISSFIVHYVSKASEALEYKVGDTVSIEIVPRDGMSLKKYRFKFEAIDSFKSVIPVPPFDLFDNVVFQVAQ